MFKNLCLALAMISAMSAFVSAEPGTKPTPSEPKSDIFETAVESGHLQKFIMAVESAGLVDTLRGDGPFTVFVPSNEAFDRLPSGEFHDLLKPENKDKLKQVLLAHVIPGRVRMADLKKHMEVKSVGGPLLEVVHHFITGTKVGTAKHMAHVQNSDVEATNGVIHIVNAVIMP
jgi:uncharacterized surface protein with fasciclin (FAS1) repeats